MKALAVLFALVATASADGWSVPRRHGHHHKRQVTGAAAAAVPTVTPTPTTTTGSSPLATTTGPPPLATTTGPPPLATGTGIPPLSMITLGMPTHSTLPVSATFAAGAIPPVASAPPLPAPFVFNAGEWPNLDKQPDTTSDEVQQWMKELNGFTIPDIPPTVDGSCAGDPAAAANAANRGWWTCGGYTRATDITACPDKQTWGVSFDDGPSPYTQSLLNYLSQEKISATFFVVGSRVIERPALLVEEYMQGHEISVHTWSHPHLTTLTNEEIVAELGWTRKAIKTVLGVTPTTMRPPYGDIDDRVRAISLAMGMVPILWTSTPQTGPFDTNDWKVAAGIVSGAASFAIFNSILGNATNLNTGFIVLQHDLYEIAVDLAIGYTLNAAQTYTPPFALKPIGVCMKLPTRDLYRESTSNTTFPYHNTTFSYANTTSGTRPSTMEGVLGPLFSLCFAVALALVGIVTV